METPDNVPTEAKKPQSADEMAFPREVRLGELLVCAAMITKSQLQEALEIQQKGARYRWIGQILVERNAITQKQLNLFLDIYRKRPQLGEILVKSKTITRDQLNVALEHQKAAGLPLGEILLKLKHLTEETLRQALSTQLNIPFIDLGRFSIDRSLARLINKTYAKRHHLVPIARLGNTITVAMDDPTDVEVINELQSLTGFTVNVVTATHAQIQRAFSQAYAEQLREGPQIADRLELITDHPPVPMTKVKYREDHRPTKKADDLVRNLINIARAHKASDIHLETVDRRMQARFRIDGVLQALNLGVLDDSINVNRGAIISRIKVLGNLDIAEKRRPQDGSFRVHVIENGHILKIDVRISIIPGYYGENVVLRMLDPRDAPTSPEQLGFSRHVTEKLSALLQRTSGMLLITGPTGSGKSTTLFAALMAVYRPEIKILTAEDPIEYVHEDFTQCEVNDKIGNTFASYLRSFLRHDPEVIMLGEIRDNTTAEMAFRAAQTGHLLLSTLHTNDAISAVTRLIDLGIDPNLVSSSLLGVLAQRLVREICFQCREQYMPSDELLREFFVVPPTHIRWYKGRGCPRCHFTGYRGRVAVAELWIPNENDIILINKGAPFDEIRASSYNSTVFMAEDVKDKLYAGKTTLDELIRTLPYSSVYQFRHSPAYQQAAKETTLLLKEERTKVSGKARVMSGSFEAEIGNGSDWTITDMVIHVVAKDKNGSVKWDRKFTVSTDIRPRSTGHISFAVTPEEHVSSHDWYIDEIRGYPGNY